MCLCYLFSAKTAWQLSKGRFFLQNESIRITNRIESIRIANWNALMWMLTVGLVFFFFIVQTLSFMHCTCNFICGLPDVIIKTSVSQSVRQSYWYVFTYKLLLRCVIGGMANCMGTAFLILCGVRQGGILSPFLLAIYVDDHDLTYRQALSTARFCRTGQLATADTWFRTCRTSSFFTVAWQLARFQLTRRIARSLGDSWASLNLHSPSTPSQTHSTQILGFILIGYLFISKNNKCQTQMLKKQKEKNTKKRIM